jgi:peroxiredoxin
VSVTPSPTDLPDDLPVPEDDGAADHLVGTPLPHLALVATDGTTVDLAATGADRRLVVFAYPRTGRPGEPPLVADWDRIPGARGCTPEACGFRDLAADFAGLGVGVYGLSTQDTDYQREAVERLRLPYPLLSDADLSLTGALALPTFEVAGTTLLKRLTMIVVSGVIAAVDYPVFPPDDAAVRALQAVTRLGG